MTFVAGVATSMVIVFVCLLSLFLWAGKHLRNEDEIRRHQDME